VRSRYEITQWIIWQMANQGPKTGECGHFRRLGDTRGDQSYAVRRFTDYVGRAVFISDEAAHAPKGQVPTTHAQPLLVTETRKRHH
jgi:GST-like protein